MTGSCYLRIPLANGDYLTLVSVYTSTMQRTSEEKEFFYKELCSCIAPAQNNLVIILVPSMPVWGETVNPGLTLSNVRPGKHGVGKINSNGVMLLEFCTWLQLSIMGTMFQLKDSLKNTWQHLRSKHWHQLDHVVANQPAKPFIKVTKVN